MLDINRFVKCYIISSQYYRVANHQKNRCSSVTTRFDLRFFRTYIHIYTQNLLCFHQQSITNSWFSEKWYGDIVYIHFTDLQVISWLIVVYFFRNNNILRSRIKSSIHAISAELLMRCFDAVFMKFAVIFFLSFNDKRTNVCWIKSVDVQGNLVFFLFVSQSYKCVLA